MQELKDNEPQPKFTGSYKKKCVWEGYLSDVQQDLFGDVLPT